MACSSTQNAQFAGLRDKAASARNKASNRLAQAREAHPRFDQLGGKFESARDRVELKASASKAKVKESKAGQALSNLKARVADTTQGLLAKVKRGDKPE